MGGVMKVFAMVVIAVVGAMYGLNRGLYVGDEVFFDRYWYRECRYLYPSGIIVVRGGGWETREKTEQTTACKMFHRE